MTHIARLLPRVHIALAAILVGAGLLAIAPASTAAAATAPAPEPAATPVWERALHLTGANDERTSAVVPLPDGGALLAADSTTTDFGTRSLPRQGATVFVERVDRGGRLVASWGTGGITRLAVAGATFARSLAVDGAGRTYVLGWNQTFGNLTQSDLIVARLRADGHLDPAFGTGGVRRIDLSTVDTPHRIVIDPWGRPLISVGVSNLSTHERSAQVIRLAQDGSPDPSFGTEGAVRVFDPDSRSEVAGIGDLNVGPTGAVTVALTRYGTVWRFTDAGTPDTTWGANGYRWLPGGVDSHFYAPIVRADGSVVATFGTNEWDLEYGHPATVIVGLTPNGASDPRYGTGSVVQEGRSGGAIAALPGGGVLLVRHRYQEGATENRSAVAVKVRGDGSIDHAFGGGEVEVALSGDPHLIRDLPVRAWSDGRVLVGLTVSDNGKHDTRMLALTTSGRPDPAFGDRGTFDHGLEEPQATFHEDSAVDRRGRTLILAQSGTIPWLVRLTPAGRLDTTFGGTGAVRLPDEADFSAALVVRDDGSVVVATQFATLHDIDADGSAGERFDGQDTRQLPVLDGQERWDAEAATALADGGFLLVGSSQHAGDPCSTSWVERFDVSGRRVPRFGSEGRVRLDGCAGSSPAMAVDRGTGTFTLAHQDSEPNQSSSNELVLDRFLLDGTPDATFGDSGRVREALGTRSLTAFGVDAARRIVVQTRANYTPGEVRLHRYSALGTLDPTFGTAGTVMLLPTGYGGGVAVAPDGSVVAVSGDLGSHPVPPRYHLHRVDSDGSFDARFGAADGIDLGQTWFGVGLTGIGRDVVTSSTEFQSEDLLVRRWSTSTEPTATAVEPLAGRTEGGEPVTITGHDLTQDTQVFFGAVPAASVEWVDASTIRAVTPATAAGTVPVSVSRGSSAPNDDGTSPTFTFRGPRMVGVTPTRLLDTRPSQRVGAVRAKPGPGDEVPVHVTGIAGVPSSGVAAVALSVTGTEATGDTWITAWPCGTTRPLASNLNLSANATTAANQVLVAPGAGGEVCLFASAPTHLVVDVLGWLPADAGFTATRPSRVVDTRSAGRTTGGETLTIRPGGSLPALVALTVTVTGTAAPGWVTVVPCGGDASTSSVNYDRSGQTIANLVVVAPDPQGRVCLASSQPADLVVDLAGWWGSGEVTPITPQRMLDTRPGGIKLGYGGGRPTAGQTIELHLQGHDQIPSVGVRTFFLNITVTGTAGPGYLTVWPCGRPRPLSSNLNVTRAGQTVAALASSAVGTDGAVCIYTSVATDLVVDVPAWLG